MDEVRINVVTEEAFDAAVKKAMEEFDAKGNNGDGDEKAAFAKLVMSMQNALFASLIRANLFPKTEN